MLKHLAIVTHYSRKNELLTQGEISELREACKAYPAAIFAAYPERKYLTVKVHLIERHLMFFIDKYGTLGMFGEDGIESLHPWDNRCRMLTRSIRNPIKRVMATNKHLAAKQLAKPKKQAKKKRTHEEYVAHRSERKERGDAKRAKSAGAPGATPLLLDASRADAAIEMDPQP